MHDDATTVVKAVSDQAEAAWAEDMELFSFGDVSPRDIQVAERKIAEVHASQRRSKGTAPRRGAQVEQAAVASSPKKTSQQMQIEDEAKALAKKALRTALLASVTSKQPVGPPQQKTVVHKNQAKVLAKQISLSDMCLCGL